MKTLNTDLIIAAVMVALLYGCGNRGSDVNSSGNNIHPDSLKEYLDYANQALSEHEEKIIDQYVMRHELKLIRTQTGLRYTVYRQGSGPAAGPDDLVVFNYKYEHDR